jgi:hypothetical protein
MQLSLDAGLRLCGGGSKVTSGTEVVSCAESRYPRGLSGGCAGWGGGLRIPALRKNRAVSASGGGGARIEAWRGWLGTLPLKRPTS